MYWHVYCTFNIDAPLSSLTYSSLGTHTTYTVLSLRSVENWSGLEDDRKQEPLSLETDWVSYHGHASRYIGGMENIFHHVPTAGKGERQWRIEAGFASQATSDADIVSAGHVFDHPTLAYSVTLHRGCTHKHTHTHTQTHSLKGKYI